MSGLEENPQHPNHLLARDLWTAVADGIPADLLEVRFTFGPPLVIEALQGASGA